VSRGGKRVGASKAAKKSATLKLEPKLTPHSIAFSDFDKINKVEWRLAQLIEQSKICSELFEKAKTGKEKRKAFWRTLISFYVFCHGYPGGALKPYIDIFGKFISDIGDLDAGRVADSLEPILVGSPAVLTSINVNKVLTAEVVLRFLLYLEKPPRYPHAETAKILSEAGFRGNQGKVITTRTIKSWQKYYPDSEDLENLALHVVASYIFIDFGIMDSYDRMRSLALDFAKQNLQA
jgi:hypothetical protein